MKSKPITAILLASIICILPSALSSFIMSFSPVSKDDMTERALTLDPTKEPIGSFTFEPKHPCVNETINFNASESYDSDGYIINYYWKFGDGANGTGMIAEHSYAEAGSYTVRLTVIDNDEFLCIVLKFLNVT